MKNYTIKSGTIKLIKNAAFATVMLNKETGEIWADEFVDCNSYIVYENPAIMKITSKKKLEIMGLPITKNSLITLVNR